MSHRLKLLLTGYLICSGTVSWFLPTKVSAAVLLNRGTESISQVVDGELQNSDRSDRLISQSSPTSQTVQTTIESSTLKMGSRGSNVLEAQTILQQMGYDLTPDGIFGEKTRRAVVAFQKQFELPVDGQISLTTWQQLQTIKAQLSSADFQANIALESQPTDTEAGSLDAPTDGNVPDGATVPENEEEAAPTDNGLGWLRWLLGLMSVGALVWVIYYVIKRPQPNRIKSSKRQSRFHTQPEVEAPAEFRESEIAESSETKPYSYTLPEQTDSSNGVSGQIIQRENSFEENTAQSSLSFQVEPNTELTRLNKVNIVEELITDLHSLDPIKRRKAIWELGQRGDSRAVQPLVDMMVDADSHQRSLILAAISEIGIRTLKPMNRALIVSLQDENADVRKNAIRDVTRIYDLISQISQVLRHASEDPDKEVRETARWAISQLNRVRGMAELDDQPNLTGHSSTPDSLPSDASSYSDNNSESKYNNLF
jgi:peptidoglycan hydrolase-like protein with peptidoglycan-binding domain